MCSNVRLITVLGILVGMLAGVVPASAQEDASFPIDNDEFAEVWERTDAPVAQLAEQRTWIWGPEPRTGGMREPYAEAPAGRRLVQYFDKSRMEYPTSDLVGLDSPWVITQGLLATELMTGNLQLGHADFEQHDPAEIPVAGDRDDTSGPTYAAMGTLMDKPARASGDVITDTVSRDGSTSQDGHFAQYNVTDEHYDDVTGHNIASVFWEFMNREGTISVDGELQIGPLFENPYYAVGRPLTEAYWANILLDGSEADVLIQCFERRCLTYTPGNPEGWQVESGNIGLHYREWRYEIIQHGDPEASTYIEEVQMPSELTFAPDGRMFFIEVKQGTIRVVEDDQLLDEPFATLDIAGRDDSSEYGLLGLALHPEFEENGYVYAFYTAAGEDGQPIAQRIVRFTDHNNTGADETVVVDGLPYGPGGNHNAGRIAFGPDGMLYVTLGDTGDPGSSQNVDTLSGSILRYTPDGAVPDDNPFGPSNPVYAYGLRNPFGLAFHPETGDLYATDNGPNGYDEVNRIVAGGNYGWPVAYGYAGEPDHIDPIWATGESQAIAPTGIDLAEGGGVPDVAGQVLFCGWNTGELTALELDAGNPDSVVGETVLPVDCQLDVAEAPSGVIFTATESTIFQFGPAWH